MEGNQQEILKLLSCRAKSRQPDTLFDSPQAGVAFGCLTEEMVEKVSGVEVAQHDSRMRTRSSWPANT